MKKIGFIGLGAMGQPMAQNLVQAGFPLFVNDMNQDAVKTLVQAGAVAKNTPAEMAPHVDILITMLPNATIVKTVLTGENGFLQEAKPGQILIDMSTVSPHETRELAEIAKQKGLSYMDAPVSGGVNGAQKASLTLMIGAQTETLEATRPMLEAMGKKLYHLGDVGSGNAMKIVNNMLLGLNMLATGEAIFLARQMGLDLEKMCDVVKESSGNSYVFDSRAAKCIENQDYTPGFAIDLQYKDLCLAQNTAQTVGAAAPILDFGLLQYEKARAQGLGSEDIAALYKIWDK